MPDSNKDSSSDQLPFEIPERPPGMVSSSCDYTDHNGQRFVQIRGVNCYVYDLDDRVSASMIWINIHRAGHAQLVEIAEATELTVSHFATLEKYGIQGLSPKPKSGRPRTIPAVERALAVMLINCGKKPGQVTRQLGISYSSLRRILEGHNEPPSDQWLDFGDDDHQIEQTSLEASPGALIETDTDCPVSTDADPTVTIDWPRFLRTAYYRNDFTHDVRPAHQTPRAHSPT